MVTSLYFLGIGIAFFYLLAWKGTQGALKQKLKTPFICYCSAIFIEAAFAPIRTLMKQERGMQVVDFWAEGLQWLAVGMSVLLLAKVYFDDNSSALSGESKAA